MRFVLRPNTYPVKIGVWIGRWDAVAAHRFLRSARLYGGSPVESPGENNAACCYNFTSGHSLIWLPARPRTIDDIGMLTHEAVHAAINTGEYLGFKLSDSSDEYYTYMVQFIVEEVLRRTRK